MTKSEVLEELGRAMKEVGYDPARACRRPVPLSIPS